MLIAGWADGYRNNTFRTVERLHVPWRLLAGPWVHKDPSTARPGPNLDCDREIIAFFDQHLRGGPPSSDHRGQVFVRGPTPPQPDLAVHEGTWREIDVWPPPELRTIMLTVDPTVPARRRAIDSPAIDELAVAGRRRHVRVELVRGRSAVGPTARSAGRQRRAR